MVSPFFCSIDCFPLTASAYPPHCTPQGTSEAAQRADPAAAHPDSLTAHHGQPCLERLDLLGRHGFDNVQKPSFFLSCFCIFSSSAHHYVLTPPLPFGQIAHREAESLKRCQCHPQRVALADTQGSSDLLWDDDAAEIVDPPHNSGCFHAVLPPIYGSSVVMVVVFTVNRK